MDRAAFAFYLLYCASFFARFPARYEFLAAVRLDLLLMLATVTCLWLRGQTQESNKKGGLTPGNILIVLIGYIVVSVPFVQWPGSVVHTNSFVFLKAILFYYFSVALLTNENRLLIFVGLFVGCQVFRILEPLYLHITTGYWGSFTHMGGGELMDRLSGAPADIVNPNGLAFVIVSVLPFLHYLLMRQSLRLRIAYLTLLAIMLYALVLTASRSGFVALAVVALGIALKSKHRIAVLSAIGLSVAIGFANMTDLQKDRYLSTVKYDVRGGETSRDRIEGILRDYEIGMKRPIFGHGLGTSIEAISHDIGYELISHNLFTEIFQELGIIGLAIFLFYIRSIFKYVRATLATASDVWDDKSVIGGIVHGLHIWLWMNLLFSLASYGLSTYQWYLFGGLAVVLHRLALKRRADEPAAPEATPVPAT